MMMMMIAPRSTPTRSTSTQQTAAGGDDDDDDAADRGIPKTTTQILKVSSSSILVDDGDTNVNTPDVEKHHRDDGDNDDVVATCPRYHSPNQELEHGSTAKIASWSSSQASSTEDNTENDIPVVTGQEKSETKRVEEGQDEIHNRHRSSSSSTRTDRTRCRRQQLLGLVIVLVTMFVLVVLLDNNTNQADSNSSLRGRKDDDGDPNNTNQQPSDAFDVKLSPPPPPTMAYRHLISRLFGVRVDSDDVDVYRVVEVGSPQHQALVYLSDKLYTRDNEDDDDDDDVEFQKYDRLTFRQLVNRYVLLTIWFAWNGKGWTLQQEGNDDHRHANGIEGWVQFQLHTPPSHHNITDIQDSNLEKYQQQQEEHLQPKRYYDIREPNSICFWTGVACRYSEIIVGIHLSSLSLSGNIMDVPELRFLPDLQQLDLSQNNLRGTIPFWWGDLTNLRHLKLHENYLSGPVPREFMNKDIVPNLVEATFHHNGNLYGLHYFGSPPSCNVSAPTILTSDCAGSSFTNESTSLNEQQQHPQSTKYTPRVFCPCCNVCCTNSDSASPLIVHYNESSSSWFPVSSANFDEKDDGSIKQSRNIYPPSCINVYPQQ